MKWPWSRFGLRRRYSMSLNIYSLPFSTLLFTPGSWPPWIASRNNLACGFNLIGLLQWEALPGNWREEWFQNIYLFLQLSLCKIGLGRLSPSVEDCSSCQGGPFSKTLSLRPLPLLFLSGPEVEIEQFLLAFSSVLSYMVSQLLPTLL